MNPELIAAFVTYALVTSITPGPNNTLLLASGLNFGLRRTLPQILGISLGFTLMVLAAGFGFNALFSQYPALYVALRYLGAAYLAWLALRIAVAKAPSAAEPPARPFTVMEAALFQWVNPKAWIMAIGAISTYVPMDGYSRNVAIVAVLFALINLPSVAVWALAGKLVRRLLAHPARLRAVNLLLGLALLLSIVPILRA